METRIPLDYFEMGEGFVSYEQMQTLCKANPLSSWAAYIGGSIFTLLKEESIHLPFGFNMFLLSGVPMNVGIGSSADHRDRHPLLPAELPRARYL